MQAMVIATTFPYDTSDDDTESGQGESTGAAPPTFNGGLSAPGDMSAVAKMAQEFSEEISNGPVWDRNGFLNGKTTTPASNHTIATMPTCAYGMRHLYQKEELSTDEQSCGDPTWEDNPKDSKTVPQFRIYKKSGRRKRRARRKKICLAITLLGLLIVIISISVGVANKRSSNKPSSSKYSAVSASKSRDPAEVHNPGDILPTGLPQAVVLASNRFLKRGNFVSSPSGAYRVGLDNSGNFVMEDRTLNQIWSTGTSGGNRLNMQSDGNLIVRDATGKSLWTSQTYGNTGAVLVVDDSGRIAIMNGDNALWLDGIPREVYSGPSSEDLAFPARGIFYYPWYPQTWTVNGKPVKFVPDLGLYSSSDPLVASAHIDALDYAHIDLSIASWWGPDTNLDRARLTVLMDKTVEMNSTLKWTIYHEHKGGLQPSVEQIRRDLAYLRKWFAWHSTWANKDGRPIIFVYNGDGCDVVERWMDASNGEWYVVLKLFSKFRDCTRQPDSWHQYGVNGGNPLDYSGYSFSIAPGFWRADQAKPKTPRVSCVQWCTNSQMMSQSQDDWHIIITFNEAGEGTNIEASPHWASETKYGYYLDCLHQYPTLRRP